MPSDAADTAIFLTFMPAMSRPHFRRDFARNSILPTVTISLKVLKKDKQHKKRAQSGLKAPADARFIIKLFSMFDRSCIVPAYAVLNSDDAHGFSKTDLTSLGSRSFKTALLFKGFIFLTFRRKKIGHTFKAYTKGGCVV